MPTSQCSDPCATQWNEEYAARGCLLLDLHPVSPTNTWLMSSPVWIRALGSGPLWPVWLLWPSWGLHQVGRCLSHWSSHHRLPGFYVHMRSCDCFYQAQQHALGQSIRPELCYILLFGVGLSYCMTFFLHFQAVTSHLRIASTGAGDLLRCLLLSPADQDKLHCPHLRWGKEWRSEAKIHQPEFSGFHLPGSDTGADCGCVQWLILDKAPGTRRHTLPEKRKQSS